jgi:hypothetical protein
MIAISDSACTAGRYSSVGDLGARGQLQQRVRRVAARRLQPHGQELVEPGHPAHRPVPDLPRHPGQPGPVGVQEAGDLGGRGERAEAADDVLEGAAVPVVGDRRRGLDRPLHLTGQDVELRRTAAQRAAVAAGVVEGEAPVHPQGRREDTVVVGDRGETGVEIGAVRRDDPRLLPFRGAHTARADPFHGAFLDLMDMRVDRGFQGAEQRRQFHFGRTQSHDGVNLPANGWKRGRKTVTIIWDIAERLR